MRPPRAVRPSLLVFSPYTERHRFRLSIFSLDVHRFCEEAAADGGRERRIPALVGEALHQRRLAHLHSHAQPSARSHHSINVSRQ